MGAKRRRLALSCVDCRRRKVKCGRETPSCTRCVRSGHGATCSYVQYDERSQPGLPTPTDDRADDRRDTTPCPSSSEEAEHWQRPTAPVSKTAPTGSSLKGQPPTNALERLQERVSELENCIKAAGSTPVLGERPPGLHQSATPQAPPQEDGLRDCERSLLRGRSFKTQYFGPSHAASLLSQFEELSAFVKDILKRTPALLKFKDRFKASRKTLPSAGNVHEDVDFQQLVAMVPARERTDVFVAEYFETYETTYRVLHTPTFTREYEQFWVDQNSARAWFIVQLLLVCASVNWAVAGETDAFVGRSSVVREQAASWITATESWLGKQSHKHTPLEYFQTHILLVIAKRNISYKVKREWMTAGTLLRLVMSAGFHREPSHLSKKISVFDQEMRRRLWHTILELDLQASCTRGMRAAVSPDDWDCLPPLNIHDEDFNETTQLMPSTLPMTVFTRTSFLVSAASHLRLRLEMLNDINSLSSLVTLTSVMNYDALTRSALDTLPRYDDTASKAMYFSSATSKLQLHEFLLLLHQPFATSDLSESRYFYSRCAGRDSALTVLSIYTWPKLPLAQRLILSNSQDANLRACLAICHDIVAASSRPGSYAMDMTHERGLSVKYIRDSVELFGTRVRRLGQGFHSYWIASSALGLAQSCIYADEPAEKFAEEAAKRVMTLHDEIIAVQRPGYDGLASTRNVHADAVQHGGATAAAAAAVAAAPAGAGAAVNVDTTAATTATTGARGGQQSDGDASSSAGRGATRGVEADGSGAGIDPGFEIDEGFAPFDPLGQSVFDFDNFDMWNTDLSDIYWL